jgi:hypothetical protein
MIPEKISFRPGNLAGPMGERITDTGETPSAYMRRVVAADLGTETPEMRGNLATLKQFATPEKKTSRRKKRRE